MKPKVMARTDSRIPPVNFHGWVILAEPSRKPLARHSFWQRGAKAEDLMKKGSRTRRRKGMVAALQAFGWWPATCVRSTCALKPASLDRPKKKQYVFVAATVGNVARVRRRSPATSLAESGEIPYPVCFGVPLALSNSWSGGNPLTGWNHAKPNPGTKKAWSSASGENGRGESEIGRDLPSAVLRPPAKPL